MTELLFTTKDIAKMLHVDKSTVKRWTDEGKLKCFRTPGGHRKFRAEDLYQFMADYSYGISPVDFAPQFASDESVMRRIIEQKEFNVLASVCFSAAIKGNRNEIIKLFSETYKNGMSLPLIFDKILRPTSKKIDVLHISGKLLASEKQLAANSLSSAVVLLSGIIMKTAPNGKRAVCGTVEKDFNDLELKALAVLLETQGFEVLNLGASTPAVSVAQLVKTKRPHFVFLTASSIVDEDAVVDEHTKIQSELKAFGGKLIVGGLGFTQDFLENKLNGLYDRFCPNFKEYMIALYEQTEVKRKDEG